VELFVRYAAPFDPFKRTANTPPLEEQWRVQTRLVKRAVERKGRQPSWQSTADVVLQNDSCSAINRKLFSRRRETQDKNTLL
jgi:hypothetical protein